MRDVAGVPFGLLQCPTHRLTFYESLGWTQVHVPMWFSQPGGILRATPENVMVLRLGEEAWPEGEIDLNGLPW